MSRYKLLNEGWVWDRDTNSAIRDDNEKYLEWVAEGNMPDVADLPSVSTYRELREREYPSLGDVIDEILKVMDIPAGSGLAGIEAARQTIKDKYPE